MNIQNYNRQIIHRNRIFRDRLHPLDAHGDAEIVQHYRLSRELFLELYDYINLVKTLNHRPREIILFQECCKYFVR